MRNFVLLMIGMAVLGGNRVDAQFELDTTQPPAQTDYNLRVGNLTLDLVYVTGVSYTDNTNRSTDANTSEEGAALYNGLELEMDWPLKEWFRLHTGLQLGYRNFMSGEGDNGWEVKGLDADAKSRIVLDIRPSETTTVQVVDEFYHQLSTVQVGGDDNTRDFNTWNNRFGVNVLSQPTQRMTMRVSGGVDQTWADDDEFEFVDRTVYTVTGQLLWQLNSRWKAGPDWSFGKSEYWQNQQNDSLQYLVALTNVVQVTSRTTYTLSLGYQKLDYDSTNVPTADEETDGATGFLLVESAFNELVSHRFRFGVSRLEGSYDAINFSENIGADYGATWRFAESWKLNGRLNWTRANESSDSGEISDTYSGTVSVDFLAFDHANLRFSYTHSTKRSNLVNRDYSQDSAQLQLRWDL